LFAADQVVGYAKVFGGEASSIGLKSKTPVRMMVQRSGADKIIARVVYTGPVRAPIEAGQQIGVIKVWRGETVALETPLYAEAAVAKGSMTQKALDTAGEMMIGLFRAGAERAFAKDKAPKTQ
jgi:D-alanyl-D-alanine carboxypeptidase (penicillin-binding protein 5/6)